jgi:hypothetical protein
MTSPGIGLGDLMVFIGVLVLVSAFLIAAHSFIGHVEPPRPPAEGAVQEPGDDASSKAGLPPSASKET